MDDAAFAADGSKPTTRTLVTVDIPSCAIDAISLTMTSATTKGSSPPTPAPNNGRAMLLNARASARTIIDLEVASTLFVSVLRAGP